MIDAQTTEEQEMLVGTILYYSWGYEQTNVQFFQVVSRTAKRVSLREIEGETLKINAGGMSGQTKPIPNAFIGEKFNKAVKPYGVLMPYGCARPVSADMAYHCSWYA